jgi:hypothetical protein
LLASLPDEELIEQWGPLSGGPGGATDVSRVHLRRDLLNWARQDEEVRHWIVKAWRAAHAEVVAAADQVLTEGLTGDSGRMLEGFPAEEVLLALLTDEFDDGPELVKRFVNSVSSESQRRALLTALQHLVGDTGTACQRRVRVVILGGHPRDESKLGQRLFEKGPFEARWRTFEKKPGGGIVQRAIVNVLRHADAALIITGMASHKLMQFAKDYVQRHGIRWRCIEKATDKQLRAALRELFPELTADWY